MPRLLGPDSEWATAAPGKAELFRASFSSKRGLPMPVPNEYSAIRCPWGQKMSGFLPARARWVKDVLTAPRENCGASPDGAPA
eukprot:2786527-Pyramimonas_sp.AAC.1